MTRPTVDSFLYNIQINNRIVEGEAQYLPLVYSESINTPFITKASDWLMAVIRFSVPSDNIPLLTYAGTDYNLAIAYSSAQQPVPFPYAINPALLTYYDANVPIANDDGEIFSYSDFVAALNSALGTAWTAAKAAHAGNPSTVPPVITYDPMSGLFALTAETGAFWPDYNPGGGGTFLVTFGPRLQQLFDGLQYANFTRAASAYNPWGAEIVQNRSDNIVTFGAMNGYKMVAAFKTLANWQQVVSVAFTSDELRFQPEYVPAPYNEAQQEAIPSSNNTGTGLNPIITDFIAEDLQNVGFNETYLVFNNTAPYRWINLLGSDTVSRIGLKGWWVDDEAVFHPILISPGATASIKILFRRRSSNWD